MQKRFSLKLKNSELEIALPDRDKIIYIVGADSYLGLHFSKYWLVHGYQVYGCGEEDTPQCGGLTEYKKSDYIHWNIPDLKYSWLMFCCDAHEGYHKHIGNLLSLCKYLKSSNRSFRLAYPSSVAIYAKGKIAFTENARIAPHNEYEMAIATAENWLQTFGFESDNQLFPYNIIRLGEVYGNEFKHTPLPGLINGYLKKAKKKKNLEVPGLGNSYRSLCFIGDACEASIKFMELDFPPSCINIPGERCRIIDVVVAIANKYQVEIEMVNGLDLGNDYSPYAGNRVLSGAFFRKMVNFVPALTFKQWLATCPQ